MQRANECYKIGISASVYPIPESRSSPTVRSLTIAAMKMYLSSVLVLTALLAFGHASHDSKNQKKNAALKELAAILAEEEADAKAASLSFEQQDDDEDTSQQQEQEQEDKNLVNQQTDEDLVNEQQGDSIAYEQQEDGDDDDDAIATLENSELTAMAEESQDDLGEEH